MTTIIQNVIRRIRRVTVVEVVGGGNGFTASVVKAAVAFSNRFSLVAAEATPAVDVTAGRHAARIEQKPAVAASIVLNDAKTEQKPAVSVIAGRHTARVALNAAAAAQSTRHAVRTPQTSAVAVSRIGATGSARADVKPAGRLTASLRDATRFLQRPAAAVAQSMRAWSGTAQTPSVSVSRLGASGSARRDVKPAVDFGAVVRDVKAPQSPAAEIKQVVYSLVQNKGANSVVQESNPGRSDWQTITNAQGQHDGVSATFSGSSIAQRNGKLVLSYAAPVNKTALAITKVELHFYITQAAPAVGQGALTLSYRISGGGDVLLEDLTQVNRDEDNSVTPRIHDITAAVGGSWTTLATVKAVLGAAVGATNTGTATCDAVELHVEATLTETF